MMRTNFPWSFSAAVSAVPIRSLGALALLCSVSFAAAPGAVPQKLSVSIGGFLGSTYALELREGSLHYIERRATNGACGVVSSATVTATPQQWQEFRETIDQLNIWQWRADYPSAVADGTHWSVEIGYADHVLKAHGDNNYPDERGRPTNSSEATANQAFKRYLAAIRKLIGGRSFE
jgi:hypothetical protein